MAEVNRLGVGKTDDRCGMKALADHEPFGEMLMAGLAGQKRRAVMRHCARGVAPVPDEIVLGTWPGRPLRRKRGSRPIRDRSRSVPWRRPDVPPSRCAADRGAQRSRRTEASFQPRLKASCMETFMPWPAFGLCVWQASPAMNTRGRRVPSPPPAHRRTCRTAAGRSRRPTTRRSPSRRAYRD